MCHHAARQVRYLKLSSIGVLAPVIPTKISVDRMGQRFRRLFSVAGFAASIVSRANRAARNRSVFFALAAASLPIISRTVLVVASVFDPVDDGINLNTPLSGIMAALLSKQ